MNLNFKIKKLKHTIGYLLSAISNSGGQMAIQVLIFGTIAVFLMSGFVFWADVNVKSAKHSTDKSDAFAIAEAGIEYYRWHLAHAPSDYKDGTTSTGPYVHNYTDKDGNVLGTFTLTITPPSTGSTIVKINSKGVLSSAPNAPKTIEVRMGIPSFAKYAVVANDNLRFGTGTEIFGAVHSNLGIRFDGLAHNLVTSALSSYDDPDHDGGNEFGVHTHATPVDPLPTSSVPNRIDVFEAGRQFPVPAVDFSGITQNLSQIKASASSSGVYVASSGVFGYDLVLKTNGTYDLYKVNSLVAPSSTCASSQSGWGTWSIRTETLFATGTFPVNGLFFVEDNLWVRGQINHARITIASGRFPQNASTDTSITVNNDLTYTNYDGTDALSLIAQKNINVGLISEDDLRIDGAIVAQSGRAGRFYYSNPGCPTYHTRQKLTLYGMIASNIRYGFAYTDNTGYIIRSLNYDSNFLYGPPPSFPLTTDPYTIISWDELK